MRQLALAQFRESSNGTQSGDLHQISYFDTDANVYLVSERRGDDVHDDRDDDPEQDGVGIDKLVVVFNVARDCV